MPSALEHRFPGLSLPRVVLGSWPTPIRALEVDGGRIWVKDESTSAASYGGNKVRKLERLLAEALAQGATDVLTLGAEGSHHLLATAIHGRALGLRVHAATVPQPETAHVLENLAASTELCASLSRTRGPVGLGVALARTALRLREETGRWPFFIPLGGSSALGTLGWVEAGLEIADAVEQGVLPCPDRVYVALGSGGTAAGLLAGLRLAGMGSEIVAVRVVDRPFGTEAQLRWLARGALGLLGRHGAAVGPVALQGVRVVHDRLAGGYGHTDSETVAAVALAREQGLVLEGTYTGKAFACLLSERSRGGIALFVQTLGGRYLAPGRGA